MTDLRENQKNKYRALWEFSQGVSAVKSTPVNLQLGLSNVCNFKCVYCFDQRPGNTVPRSRLEGEVWKRLLTLIPNSGALAFHGVSEFMMDRNFFDIVGRCADAGANLMINTNGSVCTPKYVDVLKKYPGALYFSVSVDAATPETFTRIRGWHFDRVIRNIKTYVEAFENRRDRTWILLTFVIVKSNVHEMEMFVQLGKDLKVNAVRFYRLHEYPGMDWEVEAKFGGKFNYKEEYAGRYAAEYNRHIESAQRLAEKIDMRVELPAPLSEAELQEARL